MITANNAPATELWEFGSPLDHAWFHFASEEMRIQYREARGERPMSALELLMQGEVRQRLADGRLRALGIAMPPGPKIYPEVISPFLFAAQHTAIDWTMSALEGLGCKFSEVRVVHVDESPNNEGAAPSSALSLLNFPDGSVGSPTLQILSPTGVKGKGGRRDTYPYSEYVLRIIYKRQANRDLSAEKLHSTFKAEFERQFPAAEYYISAPSIRTLRDQLKRFRQDSAETGSNKSAS